MALMEIQFGCKGISVVEVDTDLLQSELSGFSL